MKFSPSFRGREAEPGIQEMRPENLWIPGSALVGSPGMTPFCRTERMNEGDYPAVALVGPRQEDKRETAHYSVAMDAAANIDVETLNAAHAFT